VVWILTVSSGMDRRIGLEKEAFDDRELWSEYFLSSACLNSSLDVETL
jgi:hypothetical protein